LDSPLPIAIGTLSASQRGAKCFTPPSFACKRRGQGDEYMKYLEVFLLYYYSFPIVIKVNYDVNRC
jgi:hypothetical protein